MNLPELAWDMLICWLFQVTLENRWLDLLKSCLTLMAVAVTVGYLERKLLWWSEIHTEGEGDENVSGFGCLAVLLVAWLSGDTEVSMSSFGFDQKLSSFPLLEDGFFGKESPSLIPHFVHFRSSLSISSPDSFYVKWNLIKRCRLRFCSLWGSVGRKKKIQGVFCKGFQFSCVGDV